jgi:phosphatidylglycerophosphatase A
MLHKLIATGLFVGNVGIAPGTLGTLVGVPLVILLSAHWTLYLSGIILLSFAGLFASQRLIEESGVQDPEEVVIDEIVGYMLAFLFVPVNAKSLVLAFILFRFLDILKPFPIRLFEALPGAYGVMADDIVAGLMTAILLWIIL